MRLNEEIRLGSLLVQKPEAMNVLKCAIGMANLAAGSTCDALHGYVALACRHPWTQNITANCPICNKSLRGDEVIWHPFDTHVMNKSLNDKWEWYLDPEMTIEQLADFVATIEPQVDKVTEAVGEHDEPINDFDKVSVTH